jgi:hypothetical protein
VAHLGTPRSERDKDKQAERGHSCPQRLENQKTSKAKGKSYVQTVTRASAFPAAQFEFSSTDAGKNARAPQVARDASQREAFYQVEISALRKLARVQRAF